MGATPYIASGSVVLAAVLWTVRLATGGGRFAPVPGTLLGADLVLLSVIAAVGILLAHGRWARRLGIVLSAVEAWVATTVEIDVLWVLALGTTAVALTVLAGPWLQGWVRLLPSATGPPWQAVALPLGLFGLPGLTAVVSPSGLAQLHWWVVILSVLTAWWYARGHPSGLWAARLAPLWVLPVLLASPILAGVTVLGASVALAALAWSEQARLAVAPLVPTRGRAIVIPRQLVPPHLLPGQGREDSDRAP